MMRSLRTRRVDQLDVGQRFRNWNELDIVKVLFD
jgi:hypothetical protein